MTSLEVSALNLIFKDVQKKATRIDWLVTAVGPLIGGQVYKYSNTIFEGNPKFGTHSQARAGFTFVVCCFKSCLDCFHVGQFVHVLVWV